MTAADIDSIIRDLTGISANTEFGGLPVPGESIFPFSRVLPKQCQGCSQSGNHKVFSAVGTSRNPTRTEQLALIDQGNQVTMLTMELISLLQQMSMGANGMPFYTAMSIGDNNMVRELTYAVSSVSAAAVICVWHTGDADPRALLTAVPNPDFISYIMTPNEDPTIDVYNALAPRCIVRFNAPSSLRQWEGWIIKKVAAPATLSDGTSFTLYFEDDGLSMSLAMTPLPADNTDPITCTVQVLPATNHEPWPYQRLIYPMLAKWTTKTIVPYSNLFTLSMSRIVYGSVSAVAQDGTILNLSGRVLVNHTGSALNLIGYDLTGITAITMTYLLESSDETDVIASGQDRCKHAVWDPSGSWADDGEFYCAKRDQAGVGLANFRANCYQWGGCPYFEQDAPTNPLTAVAKLITDYPFLQRTPLGSSTSYLTRAGIPGLMSLVDGVLGTPAGHHESRGLMGSGGWNKASVVDGVLYRDRGLQVLRQAADRSVPYFLNTATWPDYGPGGNNLVSRKGEYNETPDFLEKTQVMSRDVDVDPYELGFVGGALTGSVGKRQRFRTGEKIWIPSIGTENGVMRNGHMIYRGFWDEHFNSCAEGAETYTVRIVLAKPLWTAYAGDITTVTVQAAQPIGVPTGSYQLLYLRHKTVSLKMDIIVSGETVETTKTFAQGGTNVALPEQFCIWNYDCEQTRQGPGQSFVRPGHVLRVGDHKLWITAAAPCATAYYKGSWNPANTDPGDTDTELAWYNGNVRPANSAGVAWPIAHGPNNTDGYSYTYMTHWADRLDYIGISDPHLIMSQLGSLVGQTFTVRNDGIVMDGAAIKTTPRGGNTLTTIAGAKLIGGSGEIYIPALGNQCVVLDEVTVADTITMPSAREWASLKAAPARMMGE